MKIDRIEAMVVKAPVPGIEPWQAASFAAPFAWAWPRACRSVLANPEEAA